MMVMVVMRNERAVAGKTKPRHMKCLTAITYTPGKMIEPVEKYVGTDGVFYGVKFVHQCCP